MRWFPGSWFTDPLALLDICTPWEVAWVTRYMTKQYSGRGAAVELGPWLGDITCGMVRGIENNRNARAATIDSFDLFTFEDIEMRSAGLPMEGRLRDGEDFLDLYLHRLGDGARRVSPHKGDITHESWPQDRPIEFLFNDLAKTWGIWNHLKESFYRELCPGSTVIEQDWVHACTPWVHLWHYRYREHFEPLGHIPHSGSFGFRLTEKLPAAALEPDQLADYSEAVVESTFDWATAMVDPARRSDVRAAMVHLYTLHGDLSLASRLCVQELSTCRLDSELVSIAVPALAERLLVEGEVGSRAEHP